MKVLLTNDDGIFALGIRALYNSLTKNGHDVYVVAPMTEQSAVGHAITVFSPLRVKKVEEGNFLGFGVFGTPADCVKLAVAQLLTEKPDVVMSGINSGANVGPDVLYSGTVAAATEAAHLGFPSIAVSHDSFTATDLTFHADFAASLLTKIPFDNLPSRCVLNLNLPKHDKNNFKGLSVCPQTSAVWKDWYEKKEDPRGRNYWWLDGNILPEDVEKGTDKDLLDKGYATLTPLQFSFTDSRTMELLTKFF